MSDKKVAVLLSTYNGEKYVGAQIHSILTQSYKNIVLVVRDDGSSDKTVKIVMRFYNCKMNIGGTTFKYVLLEILIGLFSFYEF